MTDQVTILDVTDRDGLEGILESIPVDFRVEVIKRLYKAGVRCMEFGGFVSPKVIPAMHDSGEVLRQVRDICPDANFSALVPNLHGLNDAIAAGCHEITLFTSPSDAFLKANINCTVEESLQRFSEVIAQVKAQKADIRIRGALSMITWCPYQGDISPQQVATLARRLVDMGCYEIGLGDSMGRATPKQITNIISACQAQGVVPTQLSGHFHNTCGQAIANIYRGIELGMRKFESALGSLGGCPNAPGATGNVSTEEVVYLLKGLGLPCSIDMDLLIDAAEFVCSTLKRNVLSIDIALKK